MTESASDPGETETAEKPKWLRWLGIAVGLLVFAGAVYVIGQELRRVSLQEVAGAIASTSVTSLIVAILALVLCLAAASSFDTLALQTTGQPISWRRSALTSAVAFALSNAGPPGIALAAGVRYRSYQSEGLTGSGVALMSGVSALIALIGGLSLISLAAASAIQAIVTQAHMPRWVGLVIAFVALKALIAFLAAPRLGRFGKFLPSRSVRLAVIVSSTVEWAAAAGLLYILLPEPSWIGFLHYLPVFGLAGLLGAVSGLPGGIGAFDAVMIAVLGPKVGPKVGAAEVAAGLLLYRAIYILAPLIVAAVIGLTISARRLK
ncbi:YbhN family protein [Brevundimonas sp.]|uniref:lysylphosphatidylglycerol synthase transmembrane domain-containing protein n=1 Tax=Brevundimonas sp. TaxID=1871086 RepID=UPI0025B7E079|nr:YbhN family protein [Brevundimonas sp.]